MVGREQRLLLALTAVVSALLLLAALAGHAELLAYAAPALVVALPLIAGRYLGEDAIARLRERAVTRPRRRPATAPMPRPRFAALVPRGGRLLASSLAVRPPPSAAVR
jgi:hypothetical protein